MSNRRTIVSPASAVCSHGSPATELMRRLVGGSPCTTWRCVISRSNEKSSRVVDLVTSARTMPPWVCATAQSKATPPVQAATGEAEAALTATPATRAPTTDASRPSFDNDMSRRRSLIGECCARSSLPVVDHAMRSELARRAARHVLGRAQSGPFHMSIRRGPRRQAVRPVSLASRIPSFMARPKIARPPSIAAKQP
jgi:hypothetical protein